MTRAEAEAEVRSVTRRCKGPLLLSADAQQPYLERIAAATWGDVPSILSDIVALRAALGLPAVPPPEDPGKVLGFALETVRAHESDLGRPCGADFNEVVLAHPLDGEERASVCPQCGAAREFRSPLFETEA